MAHSLLNSKLNRFKRLLHSNSCSINKLAYVYCSSHSIERNDINETTQAYPSRRKSTSEDAKTNQYKALLRILDLTKQFSVQTDSSAKLKDASNVEPHKRAFIFQPVQPKTQQEIRRSHPQPTPVSPQKRTDGFISAEYFLKAEDLSEDCHAGEGVEADEAASVSGEYLENPEPVASVRGEEEQGSTTDQTPSQTSPLTYLTKAYGGLPQLRAKVNALMLTRHVTERSRELQADKKRELLHFFDACFQADLDWYAKSVVSALYINKTAGRMKNKKAQENSPYRVTAEFELDIDVFNRLIHNLAKKRKLKDIQTAFTRMVALRIPPDLDSYAGLLLCLTQLGSPAIIIRVLQDIKVQGWSLYEVVSRAGLEGPQLERLLDTIRDRFPADFADYQTARQAALVALSVDETREPYSCRLLSHLRRESITSANPGHGVLSSADLRSRAQQQLSAARERCVPVQHVTSTEVTDEVKHVRSVLASQRSAWSTALQEGFNITVTSLEERSRGHNAPSLLPYLRLLPPEVYAQVMMEVMDQSGQASLWIGMRLQTLWEDLGKRVFLLIEEQRRKKSGMTDKLRAVYADYCALLSGQSLPGNHRQLLHQALRRHDAMELLQLNGSEGQPPQQVRVAVGRFLYDVLFTYARINVHIFSPHKPGREFPAFYIVSRMTPYGKQDEILMHPVVIQLYVRAAHDLTLFEPWNLPHLAPPLPWCNASFGVDSFGENKLCRHFRAQNELLQQLHPRQLYPTLDALNAVSATPWRINVPVLDEQINLFNSGGDMALDIPLSATAFKELPTANPSMTGKERAQVYLERQRIKQEALEMFSLRQTELYRLSIANKYRDEVFFFGHNIDFRGRAYPTSANFSHIGSDVSRGVLKFARGKPLGGRGLNWLKVHLVNLTGLKKRSPNRERLEYANEIMEDILDSADRPFQGKGWWLEADEPWQALATCKEIAAALRSHDPENFVSYLPVHQDGSCNGLQHYAALGRDQVGAQSVNLQPCDAPADVYSDVVELVEQKRRRDAQEGVEIAKVLEGFLNRKVIKQTIMTTVYGVTPYGARAQIRRQLVDLEGFPEEHVGPAARYLAQATFSSLNEMFTSARSIQEWLVHCAGLASVQGNAVDWVTPLGLPVTQNYYKLLFNSQARRQIHVVNGVKQKNAFPPNFIHSLDAAHMMLTAIHCLKEGVTFASVHDCFWTHACDVDAMNKICRQQFVALHSEPVLEQLAEHLQACHGLSVSPEDRESVARNKQLVNAVLTSVPDRGNFELQNVLKSTYFFS